ncbi:MAG: WbqC family protein [Flavobacterium sp.]|nr:WbqC family protein [Flavobacterium sp.]
MESILIYPTYFPSISQMAAMIQAPTIILETEDNFQKQTNRNRMYIYSPNGIQLLNVPVKHSRNAHQKTKDVRIEKAFDWQKQHFKSLEAAYRTSPFFEYFEDAIQPIFTDKHEFLLDLNLKTIEIVFSCLRLKFHYERTHEYFHTVENVTDCRPLANGKKDTTTIEPYTQVFGEKFGFLNNLSVLDLLFNEGKFAAEYLKRQTVF